MSYVERTRTAGLIPAVIAGIFVLASLFLTAAQAETIYKFTDRYGNTTFSDHKQGPGFKVYKLRSKGWVNRLDSRANLAYARKNREKYRSMVSQASSQFGLTPELLHAVITVESAYNATAVSSAGAMGLMQLMPDTAARYGVRDAFNAAENIRGGSSYLQDLMEMFNGNLKLVLAAYNAGEGAVQKYGNSIPPYTETRQYVRKVMEHYQLLLGQQVSMR